VASKIHPPRPHAPDDAGLHVDTDVWSIVGLAGFRPKVRRSIGVPPLEAANGRCKLPSGSFACAGDPDRRPSRMNLGCPTCPRGLPLTVSAPCRCRQPPTMPNSLDVRNPGSRYRLAASVEHIIALSTTKRDSAGSCALSAFEPCPATVMIPGYGFNAEPPAR